MAEMGIKGEFEKGGLAFGASAAMFGVGAAFVGLSSLAATPPGAAAAATMTASAAIAGGLSIAFRYGAKCPPRMDFNEVVMFERTDLELPEPHTEFESALQGFLQEQLNLRRALDQFVVSLERQQGTECVLKGEIGSDEDAARAQEMEPRQHEATLHNLAACSSLLGNSLEIAPQVNGTWQQFRQEEVGPRINELWLRRRRNGLSGGTFFPPIVDIQETREAANRLREGYHEAREQYRFAEFFVSDELAGNSMLDRVLDHPSLWQLPEILLPQRWIEITGALVDVELVAGDGRPSEESLRRGLDEPPDFLPSLPWLEWPEWRWVLQRPSP